MLYFRLDDILILVDLLIIYWRLWVFKYEEYFVIFVINEYLLEIIFVVLFVYIWVIIVIEFIVDIIM